MIITTANFRETAKAWAKENPQTIVNGVKEACNLTWASACSEYNVNGKPIIEVLQEWILSNTVQVQVSVVETEQASDPAFPPITSLDLAIKQVKRAGFVVCFDEEYAKMDFAIDTVENTLASECRGVINRLEDKGFWICHKNNELEAAMKDHLQNDGWIVYRDADSNEEDTIDCLRLKGWTITPPKPKQWIVNAEAIIKFTETIEADTEEEAHEIMRQKYENGDLDNGLGNDAQFGLTGTSPV